MRDVLIVHEGQPLQQKYDMRTDSSTSDSETNTNLEELICQVHDITNNLEEGIVRLAKVWHDEVRDRLVVVVTNELKYGSEVIGGVVGVRGLRILQGHLEFAGASLGAFDLYELAVDNALRVDDLGIQLGDNVSDSVHRKDEGRTGRL